MGRGRDKKWIGARSRAGSALASTQPNQGPKLLERILLSPAPLALAQVRLLPHLRLHECGGDHGRSSSRSGGPWHRRRHPRQENHGPQSRPDPFVPRAVVHPPSRIMCLFS